MHSYVLSVFFSRYPHNCILLCLQAIADRDFAAFCELSMRDSNEMHAACLDTFPPCTYMTDTSHAVVSLVHEINRISGRYVVSTYHIALLVKPREYN